MTQALPPFILAIFPRPRRPVTFASAVPMISFVVVFGAVCFLLDRFDVILFSRPAAFWILLLVPWFWWMNLGGFSGLTGVRNVVSLMVRLILVGIFVILLAEPRSVRKSDAMAVVFVVDLSMSVGTKWSEEAMRYVSRVNEEKPVRDELGLILFGRNAAVELPPATSFPLDENLSVTLQIDREGTNLQKALSLAAAILPDDKQGRIVLITDGVATDGSYASVLDQIKSRGIAVDVLPIEYDNPHEVRIERLELPRRVKVQESYEASVVVSSLQAGKGELVLLENGQLIMAEPQKIKFNAGKNRYTVPIYLREPGYYEYTVRIIPEKDEDGSPRDGFEQNNQAISYLHIKGEGKLLLISDPDGDDRDWRHLSDTLRQAGRVVERRSSYDFPTDPLSLLPYDCIVFVNVPRDAFVASQLAALRDAVMNQGSGFLMVGGDKSYGPGGYHRTEVEKLLPVTMDVKQKKFMPKGALVVILHTCEFAQGNTWAKKITQQAIKVLDDQDEVGVSAYTMPGGDKWLFDLTPASEYPRLATIINRASIGDMPSFGPTMKMGLTSLKNSDASVKHMIIISDGDPQSPGIAMLREFKKSGITIATVAVFPHGTSTQLMKDIARETDGQYYQPTDPKQLPGIFIKEARKMKRSMIQNRNFVPNVSESAVLTSVLKGIDSLRQLRGYVITTLKPQATAVLSVPPGEERQDEGDDPLLAVWRHGLGQTAVFTSDFSPNWARDWLSWEKYEAFVKQLIIEISRKSRTSNLRVQSFAAAGEGVILVEDYAQEVSFLEIEAVVVGPGNDRKTVTLKQTGPGRYEGRFPLSGQGRYQIAAAALGEGRDERAFGGFVVPYSQEFLRFRHNPIVLKEIAEKTGGRRLTAEEGAKEIYGADRRTTKSDSPVTDWFLIALACLVPLDVGIRRVQIDLYLIRSWLGLTRTHTPSDETFAKLLRTKRSVAMTLEQKRREHLAPGQGELLDSPPRSDAQSSQASRSAAGTTTPKSPAEQGEEVSTTQRLLAARRRMQEEDND